MQDKMQVKNYFEKKIVLIQKSPMRTTYLRILIYYDLFLLNTCQKKMISTIKENVRIKELLFLRLHLPEKKVKVLRSHLKILLIFFFQLFHPYQIYTTSKELNLAIIFFEILAGL